ncbi:MAG: phage terminase large subunit [Victivallaceae bacterium]|nr:phage terminase large subunit [Victivallaceae bacterium]
MFEKTSDQTAALRLLGSEARHILLFGGSRSGKTFILVYSLIVRALKAPGSRHMILKLHSNSVRQSVWFDTFRKVLRLAFEGVCVRENLSDGFVLFPNGSEIWFDGLDSPDRADRILGREFATVYFNECSELAYDSISTALTRLAQKTPLRNKAYYDCNPSGKRHWSYRLFLEKVDPVDNVPLAEPEDYRCMLMNPGGNQANLPDGYLEKTLAQLPGKRRKRFLEGLWQEEVEGALWTSELIAQNRVLRAPENLCRVVVGVDPAVSGDGDMTGIVTAARGDDGAYYVLSDDSIRGTPSCWAEQAINAFHRHRADRIVAEVNNGGDLVESLFRSLESQVAYASVRASRGKYARAEPIQALYEAGRVHHVGVFPELEEQMTSFVPGAYAKSPDRMDALVWAVTFLADGAACGKSRMIEA